MNTDKTDFSDNFIVLYFINSKMQKAIVIGIRSFVIDLSGIKYDGANTTFTFPFFVFHILENILSFLLFSFSLLCHIFQSVDLFKEQKTGKK